MTDAIKLIKRRNFSAVPDDILENRKLSLQARAVLGWMVGRQAGWDIYVAHLLRTLGLSDYRWATIRDELQAAGYYRQQRVRMENGKFAWIKEVTDTPTIPEFLGDGPLEHGSPVHGELGDITTKLNNKTKHHPPTPQPSAKRRGGGGGTDFSKPLEDQDQEQACQDELQGRQAAEARGEIAPQNKINHPSKWLAKLREAAAAGDDVRSAHGQAVLRRREAQNFKQHVASQPPPKVDAASVEAGRKLLPPSLRARLKEQK